MDELSIEPGDYLVLGTADRRGAQARLRRLRLRQRPRLAAQRRRGRWRCAAATRTSTASSTRAPRATTASPAASTATSRPTTSPTTTSRTSAPPPPSSPTGMFGSPGEANESCNPWSVPGTCSRTATASATWSPRRRRPGHQRVHGRPGRRRRRARSGSRSTPPTTSTSTAWSPGATTDAPERRWSTRPTACAWRPAVRRVRRQRARSSTAACPTVAGTFDFTLVADRLGSVHRHRRDGARRRSPGRGRPRRVHRARPGGARSGRPTTIRPTGSPAARPTATGDRQHRHAGREQRDLRRQGPAATAAWATTRRARSCRRVRRPPHHRAWPTRTAVLDADRRVVRGPGRWPTVDLNGLADRQTSDTDDVDQTLERRGLHRRRGRRLRRVRPVNATAATNGGLAARHRDRFDLRRTARPATACSSASRATVLDEVTWGAGAITRRPRDQLDPGGDDLLRRRSTPTATAATSAPRARPTRPARRPCAPRVALAPPSQSRCSPRSAARRRHRDGEDDDGAAGDDDGDDGCGHVGRPARGRRAGHRRRHHRARERRAHPLPDGRHAGEHDRGGVLRPGGDRVQRRPGRGRGGRARRTTRSAPTDYRRGCWPT